MVKFERVLLNFYEFLLRFYPRQFRQDFAAEMQTVFEDALVSAHREGLWALFRLWGRELRDMPPVLVHEHWQSVRDKEAGVDKNMQFMAGKGDASPVPGETPVRRRGEIFMAILPFLLLLLVDMVPMLLIEGSWLSLDARGMQIVNISLIVLMAGTVLPVFFLAWRRKWPAWSATWVPFFAAIPLLLTGALLSWLFGERLNYVFNQNTVMFVVLPLIVAVLLYSVTRASPLRGLLTVLPVLYLLWLTNMESVPVPIKAAVKIPSIALICLATAYLLRQGNWRSGLYAVLAMNLAVGVLFSYAGIYHGGTLPNAAPGPNLVEVARSLIPQYLAGGAILLGPLFAWKIRQAGLSGGRFGRLSYHLALDGLLLVILANLVGLMQVMESSSASSANSNRSVLMPAILLGLGFYLVGLFFLYRDIRSARSAAGWAKRLLLTILPLAIPVTFMLPFITWKWPVSDLYGIPLLWVLPHTLSLSIGLVWLALSVWVVTQAQAAGPTAAVQEAPKVSHTDRTVSRSGV